MVRADRQKCTEIRGPDCQKQAGPDAEKPIGVCFWWAVLCLCLRSPPPALSNSSSRRCLRLTREHSCHPPRHSRPFTTPGHPFPRPEQNFIPRRPTHSQQWRSSSSSPCSRYLWLQSTRCRAPMRSRRCGQVRAHDRCLQILTAHTLPLTSVVFTKTTNALQDGSRLENMTWRLWHRQLLIDRVAAADEGLSPNASEPSVEASSAASEDDGSDGEWEDDSAPPSRDPVVPVVARASTRRQSSTSTIQQATTRSVARSRRLSCDPPPVLSASQPTASFRPALTSESRTNSAPDGTLPVHHTSHSTNIGRIISNLLPEKFDVAPASWALAQPLISPTGRVGDVPSTPKTQPVQFLIHSPSTPPNASDDHLVPHPPTLMVINPTPRPTPPDTPATRTRAVPTNIPAALSPGITPPSLAPPSLLSQPHSILMPSPSSSDKLVPAAALPLTPTEVSAPEFSDDDVKKRIFYVQSPEGATTSDDGRSHSGSSNSNTTSNVTDAHAALVGQHPSSLSSATTNEPANTLPAPEVESPVTPEVSAPRGANHERTSSGNAAYIRPRAAKGVKVGKPPVRVPYRGRPNTLARTTSNSSDKSRGRGSSRPNHPARQQTASEELMEDVEESEGANKQTSASTSHTVTSLPTLSAPLSMTPAASVGITIHFYRVTILTILAET